MSFSVGDQVLCYHGPKLYEAKVVQVKFDDQVPKYFVHYKGWKNKWDEWVEPTRVLPIDSDGLHLKKDLEDIHPSNDDQNEKKKSTGIAEIPVIFKLGKNFKHYVNYDWIQITRKSKIIAAPAEHSVADFLLTYAESKDSEAICIFVKDLINVLDVVIGKQLLYRQERLQHFSLVNQAKPASAIYSPVVLVRLFARLNYILQDFSEISGISQFSEEMGKISEHLITYLSSIDFTTLYTGMDEHYQSIFSIN